MGLFYSVHKFFYNLVVCTISVHAFGIGFNIAPASSVISSNSCWHLVGRRSTIKSKRETFLESSKSVITICTYITLDISPVAFDPITFTVELWIKFQDHAMVIQRLLQCRLLVPEIRLIRQTMVSTTFGGIAIPILVVTMKKPCLSFSVFRSIAVVPKASFLQNFLDTLKPHIFW